MNEQGAEGGHPNKKSQSLASSWSWTSFQIIDWRFCWLSGRSTLQHHVKYLSQWFPGPSSKGPNCTYLNYCVLGQAEYPIVWGLLNTWSESTLIPEELKQHHGSTIGMESYAGQVINRCYGRSLAHNGSTGFTNQLSAHLPNPKYIIGMYILHSWESFPFIFLGLWNKNYYREEVQVDIFETASPGQEIVSKTISQCQRMVEISNTLKDIKDARMVVPITPSFNLTLWPVETI